MCDGCDSCGARCTNGVPIRFEEFRQIRDFVSGDEGLEARAVERQDKLLPYPGVDDVFYTACRFRDTALGRCSIYPVRPLVCRLFGHVEWLPCPIEKVPGPAEGGWDVMRSYSESPLKTYEEWLEADSPSPR